ncbi:carbamoyltransferase HypF [Halonotius aquaticus]|uniref:carbamoyltransferase HypF n=1 Tax=Halonotius aquaticus TaxID=2216978 RepID=UPI00197AED43|nr:carbamoyltransferase HypF [Halonotius aquaticus]
MQISGTVQGVGFRPFVYRTAVDAGIAGYVRNTGGAVEAAFEGPQAAIEQVLQTVRTDPPPLSTVEAVDVEWRDPTGVEGFEICDSTGKHAGGVDAPVPPDTGICEACLDDLRDPDSRYHEYWATACVDCGPRFAVVEDVPYDRARTSMAAFPLCEDCRERYETPTSRRCHAQTIGCPDCGPTLRYEIDAECVATGAECVATGTDAIARAGDALTDGSILAIKGTGGIHLVCDATDPETVGRLRARTGRPAKPFACMARSVDAIEAFAEVDNTARELLTDVRSPIVLLETTTAASWLDVVAPGLSTVGVMTPYAGLHHLLFDHVDDPVVMTSANRPGQPMCTTTESVWDRLGDVVDGVVGHDREIVARCDDSVVRVVDDTPRFVRRSRGWTPTTLPNPTGVDGESPVVLAVGPERDATVAVAGSDGVVSSQHIGAVDSPNTLAFHRDAVTHLQELTNLSPDVVACDRHPDFLTTTEAEQYAADGMAGPVAVQHHHAHAAALCAEHDVNRAIVVVADGTGYGPDGTIWGGEVLDVTYEGFERVGGLSSFGLPGGEVAIEYPARILATLLADTDRIDDRLLETGAVESRDDAAVVRQQAERGVNAPTTTSAGRYLDAVSALVGACDRRTYEGEPAQRLEGLARDGTPQPIDIPYKTRSGDRVLDVQTLVRSLAALTADASAADVAATAQHALASGLATIALDTAAERNVGAVGFTGGVAYNGAISRQLRTHVEPSDCRYLQPAAVPPGDGGIAYGQAIVATARNISVADNR